MTAVWRSSIMFNGVGAKARPGDGLWTSRCGLERMGGVASAARFLGGGVVLGLLVAACGGPSHDGAAAGRGSVVSGYGLRVALPAGWSGRVFRASAKSAVELEAATVPPPPAGQFLTGDELGAGNAYVILDDLGKARRGFVSPRNGWETHPKLPLTLHRSDLHGPWEGGFPSGAALPVEIKHRALEFRIRFGSRPGVRILRQVNQLLGSLSVA